jgi:transcriptional regulator with XRE-family HTH domain
MAVRQKAIPLFVGQHLDRDGSAGYRNDGRKRIKDLRTSKGMTLDDLAKATGSAKSYVWELENKNPPRPSAEKLSAIAKALGVTVDYLFGRDEQSVGDATDLAFFREYTGLPPETKDQLRQMAKILGAKKPE